MTDLQTEQEKNVKQAPRDLQTEQEKVHTEIQITFKERQEERQVQAFKTAHRFCCILTETLWMSCKTIE